MKYIFTGDEYDGMLKRIQLLDEAARTAGRKESAIEQAIEIIVAAMNAVELESETNKTWYLIYERLDRVFQRLCREKYFPQEFLND